MDGELLRELTLIEFALDDLLQFRGLLALLRTQQSRELLAGSAEATRLLP